MKRLLLAAVTLFICTPALAAHPHPERWYQDRWCADHQGITEQVLPDGTRADCTTATHIVEFDFDKKWAEAIGQSLHYSQQTGKRAGIVLIMSPRGEKHLGALKNTIENFLLPVDIWTVSE